VLDFGLAKAAERTTGNTANSPTLTLRATEAGLILGTAGNMSPEQAAGKPVDRRADIWAFGGVLHELCTGKRLFDGETVSHTLAEVLKTEIDFTPIPAGPLRDLVKRCLDRNLKTRLRDIGEARIALENYAPPAPPTAAKPTYWPWAIAAVACLAAAGLAITRSTPEPATPIAFEVNPPPGLRFAPINTAGGSAISPDGKMLAFIAIGDKGEEHLYLRGIDSI
jgi:serine/threonine protein kinase